MQPACRGNPRPRWKSAFALLLIWSAFGGLCPNQVFRKPVRPVVPSIISCRIQWVENSAQLPCRRRKASLDRLWSARRVLAHTMPLGDLGHGILVSLAQDTHHLLFGKFSISHGTLGCVGSRLLSSFKWDEKNHAGQNTIFNVRLGSLTKQLIDGSTPSDSAYFHTRPPAPAKRPGSPARIDAFIWHPTSSFLLGGSNQARPKGDAVDDQSLR